MKPLDELCFATANVSTLSPSELKWSSVAQSCGSTSRTLILDGLFAQAGIHIICIQEGRLPHDGQSKCVNFTSYRAGANGRGSGGVQIWVANKFVKFVTAVVVRSPWLMRVVLTISKVTIHIMCGHSPYEDAPILRRTAFWDALSAEQAQTAEDKHAFTLLGIDANAHVGSIPGPSVGECERQEENENGAALRAVTEESFLKLVNTFFSAGSTWTGSSGWTSRIDYLGLDRRISDAVDECFVSEDVDLSTAEREDHHLLVCRFKGLAAAITAVVGEGKPDVPLKACGTARYTKQSMSDPARATYFQRLMSCFRDAPTGCHCQGPSDANHDRHIRR